MPDAHLSNNALSLRVMLVESTRPAGVALAEWLRGTSSLDVWGPVESVLNAIVLGTRFHPHAVILSVDRRDVPSAYSVSLLKEFYPQLSVYVLTHDVSEARQEQLLAAGADGVFSATAGLYDLAQALEMQRTAQSWVSGRAAAGAWNTASR